MKQRVYLETTIVSYLTARPSRDLIQAAHQQVTHQWWDERRQDFEVYVSQLVADEVGRGDPQAAERRMAILRGIPRLQVTEEALSLAADLVAEHALPETSVEDALHLAIAAVNGMDILVTWNCRHIANAQLIPAIRATMENRGYEAPTICTPDELFGEEAGDKL